MFGCAIAVWLAGALLAQQPQGLVQQTDLPAPGAAKSSPSLERSPKADLQRAEPASHPKETARKPSKKEAAKSEDKPEPKTETTPSPEPQKPAAGKRVAAFWFILPGG